MSMLRPCPSSPFLLLQSDIHPAILRPFISKTQIPKTVTSKNSPVSVSVSPNNHYPSLQGVYCGTNSNSSTESDTSATGVFIKGLPESTTEGGLKKAFSQFGEVDRVEIVIEKISMQPLGSAFVWFTREESTQLAAKKMNGKFCEGRFISVKTAVPGLSRSKGTGKKRPYKF